MNVNNVVSVVFSPTGGCNKMINSINSFLNDYHVRTYNITKPHIREEYTEIQKNVDFVIIAFPVYADSLPDIFNDYLRSLTISNKPVTIIAGFGNINVGKALCNTKNILEGKGNVICSACTVVNAHSYNGAELKIAEDQPSEENLQILNQFIMKSINKAKEAGRLEDCRVNIPEGSIRLQCRAPQKMFPQLLIKKPKVIWKRCDFCLVCKNMCPSGAIDTLLDIDNKKCIRCLACVKYCRKNARLFETRTGLLVNTLRKDSMKLKENVFYI